MSEIGSRLPTAEEQEGLAQIENLIRELETKLPVQFAIVAAKLEEPQGFYKVLGSSESAVFILFLAVRFLLRTEPKLKEMWDRANALDEMERETRRPD